VHIQPATVRAWQYQEARFRASEKEITAMASKPELNQRDHQNMDAFLGHVLDGYKTGQITKEAAVGALAHVMAALDLDNYAEARSWFEEGRKYLAEEPYSAS